METTFLYLLKDPDTEAIRYVGKSNKPAYRFYRHLDDALKKTTHTANWIRKLLATGKRPVLELLDEVNRTEWQAVESAYITFFRESGADLTNLTFGGEGLSNISVETRCKMKRAKEGHIPWNKGLKQQFPGEALPLTTTELTKFFVWCLVKMSTRRQKQGRASVGNKHGLGYRHTEEAKERIGTASLGNKFAARHKKF